MNSQYLSRATDYTVLSENKYNADMPFAVPHGDIGPGVVRQRLAERRTDDISVEANETQAAWSEAFRSEAPSNASHYGVVIFRTPTHVNFVTW